MDPDSEQQISRARFHGQSTVLVIHFTILEAISPVHTDHLQSYSESQMKLCKDSGATDLVLVMLSRDRKMIPV